METSAIFIAVLFLVEFVDYLIPRQLDYFGIVPWTWQGLVGILFSPLLHGGVAHLMANALSLFLLLMFLFWDHRYRPEETLLIIWIGSGIGTWLIGRAGVVHIGASSIVYGLAVYLPVAGWRLRQWRPAFVGIVVLFLYGGLLPGVLPQETRISWEGHLSGAIAGAYAGIRLRSKKGSR